MNRDREHAAFVALLRRGDRSWSTLADEVEAAGSALALVQRGAPGQGDLFAAPEDELERADRDLLAWRREGIEMVTLLDPDYPGNLLTVHQRPPVLFLKGRRDPRDDASVAVVGTRNPSEQGVAQAAEVAQGLARRGVVVVSGLAAGIDTAVHEATLAAEGSTVAVIGTGLRRTYPAQNVMLQRRIAEAGLVISQFWPDSPPTKQSFPMRNAVMSGFTLATVVVEASYRSGARMQARLALEHGRHVFLMQSLLVHDWARDFAARPGTTVVNSPDQIFTELQHLAGLPEKLVWA